MGNPAAFWRVGCKGFEPSRGSNLSKRQLPNTTDLGLVGRFPNLPALTYTVAAVDEEMGIVWLHQDFGPGSMGGPTNSLDAWEYFKTYGGHIHAVEAFMEIKPATEGFGWK